MTSNNPLSADLDQILEQTEAVWEELRNQRIFITGGTGFFGCWLLESLIWANEKLNLNINATVLTRSKSAFAEKCPHLVNQPALHFLEGDVRNFSFPDGQYSHVIHAATEASANLNLNQPLLMLDTILQGSRHTLEFAKNCGTKRFLYVSSGAVYGKQPHDLTHTPEDRACHLDPTNPASAYGIGKATAEHMSCLYGNQYGFEVKIARCFAFIGPHLPLDGTYAIGNFIRDGLHGGPIVVGGDGTPYRSYLYAADLAAWLWTILIRGTHGRPYNVGADTDYTISEIAEIVANCFHPAPEIKRMKAPLDNQLSERYVPDITRIGMELQLTPHVSLERAIQLTKQWHSWKQTLTHSVA